MVILHSFLRRQDAGIVEGRLASLDLVVRKLLDFSTYRNRKFFVKRFDSPAKRDFDDPCDRSLEAPFNLLSCESQNPILQAWKVRQELHGDIPRAIAIASSEHGDNMLLEVCKASFNGGTNHGRADLELEPRQNPFDSLAAKIYEFLLGMAKT